MFKVVDKGAPRSERKPSNFNVGSGLYSCVNYSTICSNQLRSTNNIFRFSTRNVLYALHQQSIMTPDMSSTVALRQTKPFKHQNQLHLEDCPQASFMGTPAAQNPIIEILHILKQLFWGLARSNQASQFDFYNDCQRYNVNNIFPQLNYSKRPKMAERSSYTYRRFHLQIQRESKLVVDANTSAVTEMAHESLSICQPCMGPSTLFASEPTTSNTMRPASNESGCIEIKSNPSFCYFVIEYAPATKRRGNGAMNKSTDHLCIDTLDGFAVPKSKDHLVPEDMSLGDDNNNTQHNRWFCGLSSTDKCMDQLSHSLPPYCSNISRPRHYSECSDESFICFVNEDGQEMAVDQSDELFGDLETDSDTSLSDNDDDGDDDEDGDEYENDEHCNDNTQPYKNLCKLDYPHDSQLDSGFSDLKKVRFDLKPKVHVMRAWDFAYRAARKGQWEENARDRARFQKRIQKAAADLEPILNPEHRILIYNSRFAD